MKKLYISILTVLCGSISYAQTTATDFTANDCNGTSHTLFSELDAGKIIVAAFVMPCGSCSAPSLAAYNAVQSFAASHPNTVYFYLVDDEANTTCSNLTSWGNTNSMPLATKFSDLAFNMADYGTPGMPKIVVLGGANHGIVYNKNSGVSTVGVQNAINGLLSLSTPVINEIGSLNLKVIPNPVVSDFQIDYSLEKNSDVNTNVLYIYYDDVNFQRLPVFYQFKKTISLSDIDNPKNFNSINQSILNNNWSAKVFAFIQPDTNANYTFLIGADDGIRFFINNINLLNNYPQYTNSKESNSIILNKDQIYFFYFEFYENDGAAKLSIQYKKDNQTEFKSIPDSWYKPFKLYSEINKFYEDTLLKYMIDYPQYFLSDSKYRIRLKNDNNDVNNSIIKKAYTVNIGFKFVSKEKVLEKFENPDIIIINFTKSFINKIPEYYKVPINSPFYKIVSLDDEVIINKINYVQDSVLLGNWNKTEIGGHSIAGIKCKGEKYVYNGWTRSTIDIHLQNVNFTKDDYDNERLWVSEVVDKKIIYINIKMILKN